MSDELTILNKIHRLFTEYIDLRKNGDSSAAAVRPSVVSSLTEETPQRFSFKVDLEGKFIYDPAGKWEYNGKTPIRIESPSGQFKITGTPVASGILGTYKGPWGAPRTAKQDSANGTWYIQIDTPHNDLDYALPPPVRTAVVDAQHYIARFNYEIEVDVNGKRHIDNTKNGQYSC